MTKTVAKVALKIQKMEILKQNTHCRTSPYFLESFKPAYNKTLNSSGVILA